MTITKFNTIYDQSDEPEYIEVRITPEAKRALFARVDREGFASLDDWLEDQATLQSISQSTKPVMCNCGNPSGRTYEASVCWDCDCLILPHTE